MKKDKTLEYESPKSAALCLLTEDTMLVVTSPTSGEDVTESSEFNPW